MGLHPEAREWIAQHHGVVSSQQLRRLGHSVGQIARMQETGLLVRVHQGVYRSTHWPVTEESRCAAACLAVPSAAVSHLIAGRLWGFRRCSQETEVEMLSAHRQRRRDSLCVHESTDLSTSDIVRRDDGINLTNPVRTVCDLAARLTPEDLASVIEQVLNDFRYRFITVLRTANRLARPGWAGAKRLTEVLNGRPSHAAPQDSHLEIAFRHALTRAGLPAPVPQLPIALGGDVTVHADLGYPDARLVIEVDHRTWHSGEQIAIDKRRDRLVKLAGFDTLRVTDDDLRYHRDRTVAEVAAIYGQAMRGR